MRKESISNSIPENATAAISAVHLLHPAQHFDHPRDVLADEGMSSEEKRAILASWASDIFALESIPALRLYPGTDKAVSNDEIIAALKTLDRYEQQSKGHSPSSSCDVRRALRRRPQSRRFGGLGLCSYRKGDRRRQAFEM